MPGIRKLWQYQQWAKPLTPPGQEKERTTPDKYHAPVDFPMAAWRKASTFSAAAVYPFFAVDAKQLTVPERTTPDKWMTDIEQPLFDLKRQQHLYPASVVDAKQLTLPERTTPDKWMPDTETPLFDVKRQQYDGPFFAPLDTKQLTLAERTTPDKWTPLPNLPRWDVTRNQWLYPPLAIDAYQLTQPERTTPDKYQQPFEKPMWDVRRQQFTYPTFMPVDPKQLTLHENVLADKWHPDTETPLFDQKRWPFLDPSAFLHPSPITLGSVLSAEMFSWEPRALPPPLKNAPHLYPSFAIDPYQLTLGERISADKWHPEVQRPRWDLARNQWLYPPFTVDGYQLTLGERITIDKWKGDRPDYVFRSPPYRQFAHYEMPPEEIAATVDDLPWKYRDPDFAPGPLPSRPHLYPSFSVDGKQLTLAERATPDKWTPLPNLPVWDVKRQQFLYPSFSTDAAALTLGERITPDKWLGSRPDLLFRQGPYRFFHAFEMPSEELLTVTDDVPWEYKDSFFPRRPNLRMPTLDLQVGQLLTPTPPSLDYFFQENSQFSYKNPPKRLTPEWFTTQIIPPPPPSVAGWHFLSPLVSRREPFRPPFTFETPEDEVVASVEDVGWAYADSFSPRTAPRPVRSEQALLFTPLLDLSYVYRDTPIFLKEKPQRRLYTLEPALDELVDQAVEMGWLGPLVQPGASGRRSPPADPSFAPRVAPVAPPKLDWYFQDQLLAFLRQRKGNEAMPSLHYLFLVQLLGRIVAARTVAVSDLARIAAVGLSDDMVRSSTVSDGTEAVAQGLADLQAAGGKALADAVTIQGLL